MKRFEHVLGILIFGVMLTIVVACQDDVSKSQSTAPQQEESPMTPHSTEAEKEASPQSASGNLELVGTVTRAGDGLMIMTDEGDYTITDRPVAQALDEMVGKRVKVTATLTEGVDQQDDNSVIDVIEFTEIE